MTKQSMVSTFIEKAELVSARVYPVKSAGEALEKAVEICLAKPPLEPQMAAGPRHDDTKRIMAAPNLGPEEFEELSGICGTDKGITLVKEGLRDYPWGIDLGLTPVNFGIADTGTLVLDSSLEEVRLATMLSEFHVALLKCSDIRESAFALADELKALTRETGGYTAFITGASRTADIERVLAIGVHGPLELHIMLLED